MDVEDPVAFQMLGETYSKPLPVARAEQQPLATFCSGYDGCSS